MNLNSFLFPTPEHIKITGFAIIVMAAMLAVATVWHCLGM